MTSNVKRVSYLNFAGKFVVLLTILISFPACIPGIGPVGTDSAKVFSVEKGEGIIKGVIKGSEAGLSISAEGDNPIAEANVFLDDLPDFKTKTKSDGSFEIKGVPNGEHFVVAEKISSNGTLKARMKVNISKSIPIVDVKSLVVRKTGSIQGLVKLEEADGNSLLGIDVFIGGSNLVAKTRENGAYALINVAEGTFNVSASEPGYEKKTFQIEVKAGKASTLDFTLKKLDGKAKLATIEGTALTETILGNKPLDSVIASITELGLVSLSDEDGKISFSNIADGNYKIRIYKSGYKGKIVEQKIAVNNADSRTKSISLGNINLELENKSVLSGKVSKDSDKKELEGIKVNIGPRFVYTDAKGRFSLENIEPGAYTIELSKGDKTRDECGKDLVFDSLKKDVIIQQGKTTAISTELKESTCQLFIEGSLSAGNPPIAATIGIVETNKFISVNPLSGNFKSDTLESGTVTMVVVSANFELLQFKLALKNKNIPNILIKLVPIQSAKTDSDNDGTVNIADTQAYDPTNDSVPLLYPLNSNEDTDKDGKLNKEDEQPFDPTNDSLNTGGSISLPFI